MPRTIHVTVGAAHTAALVARLQRLGGVAAVSVQPGASVQPPGDVVTVQATTAGARAVLEAVAACGEAPGGLGDAWAVATADLASLSGRPAHVDASDEGPVEETAGELRRQAAPGVNFFVLMALSGALAGVGLWADEAALVYAAQLLAPHIEPVLLVPFGLWSGRPAAAGRGLVTTIGGYALLMLGALAVLAVMRAVDPGAAGPLASRAVAASYSSLPLSTLAAIAVAALASPFVAASRRTVVMSGVYLGLPLVPGLAFGAMALATGEAGLAGGALANGFLSAGAVAVAGVVVFGVKQALVHRRRALG